VDLHPYDNVERRYRHTDETRDEGREVVALWSSVATSLACRTPEEASGEEAWLGELIWLGTGKKESTPIRPAAVQFINRERREFQTECAPASRILFGYDSDVNAWVVLWGDDTWLNYLGYDQG
jgi:hypothetical protein